MNHDPFAFQVLAKLVQLKAELAMLEKQYEAATDAMSSEEREALKQDFWSRLK